MFGDAPELCVNVILATSQALKATLVANKPSLLGFVTFQAVHPALIAKALLTKGSERPKTANAQPSFRVHVFKAITSFNTIIPI